MGLIAAETMLPLKEVMMLSVSQREREKNLQFDLLELFMMTHGSRGRERETFHAFIVISCIMMEHLNTV